MKIGFSIHMRNPRAYRSKSWAQLYQDEVELAVYCEQLGFDSCWIYEHHFNEPEGHSTSPMILCAVVAARTQRIEIGPNLVMPLHDPVLIAEEAAVIDLVSGGRFALGLVQGYRREEYEGWGIPTKERGPRLSEAVDIIRKCWSGEKFSYDGKFWTYKDVAVDPPPAHDIPILYGGRSPAGLRRCARDKVGVLSQGPGMEAPQYYAERCRELGWEPGQIRHLRYFLVSDDPEKFLAENGRYAEHMMRVYDEWIQTSQDDGVTQARGSQISIEDLKNDDLFIIGTPEQAVERILKLKADYPDIHELWGNFNFPGMTMDAIKAHLELFATKVMPAIR